MTLVYLFIYFIFWGVGGGPYLRHSGPVYINLKFEKAALFIRLGVPSTLIRQEKREVLEDAFQIEGM